MKAANAQENFRYRIEENDIVLYDRIHPSFTVAREDRSFCFAFTEYTGNFQGGMLSGKGDLTYGTGDCYSGMFSQNLRHGRGVYKFKNESKYGRSGGGA